MEDFIPTKPEVIVESQAETVLVRFYLIYVEFELSVLYDESMLNIVLAHQKREAWIQMLYG